MNSLSWVVILLGVVAQLVNGQFGKYDDSRIVDRPRSKYMQQIITTRQKINRNRRRLKKCSLDTVFQCLEPTYQYTHGPNGTGIVSSEEQYEDLCFKMHDVMPYCVSRFLSRCATPFQKQFLEMAVLKPFKESTADLCARNGPIRSAYLQHSQCAIDRVKLSPVYRRTCVRDIQAGFEYAEAKYTALWGNQVSALSQQFLKQNDFEVKSASAVADKVSKDLASGRGAFCCVFNRWQNCFGSMLQQECGPGSDDAIIGFIHQSMMGLIKVVCPTSKYAHDSDICQTIIPEKYEKTPLGIRSHSMGSYFFSLVCPNVGYGIIPERDD